MPAGGGRPIAAHVDHRCYGFELLNRFASGEGDVFATADYSRSWTRTHVSDGEWRQLRDQLATDLSIWRGRLGQLDPQVQLHVTGAITSVVHLGYHLGVVRQIDRALAGPRAESATDGGWTCAESLHVVPGTARHPPVRRRRTHIISHSMPATRAPLSPGAQLGR